MARKKLEDIKVENGKAVEEISKGDVKAWLKEIDVEMASLDMMIGSMQEQRAGLESERVEIQGLLDQMD